MIKLFAALAAVPVLSISTLAHAEVALYPTGPAEDSAFIRFVNAGTAPLDVIAQAGQPPLRLEVAAPVSLFSRCRPAVRSRAAWSAVRKNWPWI